MSVAVTPNGYADAVHQGRFMMPEERKMRFGEFLDIVERKRAASGVFYVQKQCSNLTEEFPQLLKDVDAHIPWMTEALGMTQLTLHPYLRHWNINTHIISHKKQFLLTPCI